MHEFLLKYYSLVIYSIEALAALTGVLLYRKYKHTTIKYFIFFLLYSFLVDFVGGYASYVENNGIFSFFKGTKFARNSWWFTLMWGIGAVSFYLFYFHKILKRKTLRKLLKILGFAFVIFSVSLIMFNTDAYFKGELPLIDNFGALLILLSCIFYFTEKLSSNQIFYFYKSINFYISITIFLWWLVVTPISVFDRYNTTADWDYVFLKWQILMFANLFMYITFTCILLWCKPQSV
ncbi:hypothetical protein PK35_01830 [Tamlana nanhaiensis]|uniref:Uncharacterized protein n=1 Tax=Neotamlana nanhaiensis TaxID=1382798 RepID=A0A0D7W603_9FLAO|nr:hypothetical protein PK35_01830 [Tamlana nanhaiensis]